MSQRTSTKQVQQVKCHSDIALQYYEHTRASTKQEQRIEYLNIILCAWENLLPDDVCGWGGKQWLGFWWTEKNQIPKSCTVTCFDMWGKALLQEEDGSLRNKAQWVEIACLFPPLFVLPMNFRWSSLMKRVPDLERKQCFFILVKKICNSFQHDFVKNSKP